MRLEPTLNGSSMLQCFECGNVVEIGNGIMFKIYTELPQVESLINTRTLKKRCAPSARTEVKKNCRIGGLMFDNQRT